MTAIAEAHGADREDRGEVERRNEQRMTTRWSPGLDEKWQHAIQHHECGAAHQGTVDQDSRRGADSPDTPWQIECDTAEREEVHKEIQAVAQRGHHCLIDVIVACPNRQQGAHHPTQERTGLEHPGPAF